MGDFRMPSLGADMERGKVVEWLVQPGEYVHRGEILAAVDTEKTVMEVESFEEGVLAEYLVELGETVPVGTPIARITGTPADVAEAGAGPGRADAAGGAVPAVPAPAPVESESAAHLTPPIRHLAHQLGVDVEQIHGTGKHGAVTRADVEAAAAGAPARAGAEAGTAPGSAPTAPAAPVPAPAAALASTPSPTDRVRSSPRARRLAADLGVELSTVGGTGPGGAVTESDVRREAGRAAAARAPEAAPPAPAAPVAETTPAEHPAPAPTGGAAAPAGTAPAGTPEAAPAAAAASDAAQRTASLRKAIGSLMARSKREIPHYYLSTTIDLAAAVAWMQQANAGRPIASRLVPAALLLAASARAAKDVPDVNGFFIDGEFRPSTAVHLGVAVALRGGGLVAPAIHDADTLGIDELMEQLRDLVARARAGRLQRAEMADPTITVTNLGDLGVETVFGVIYPPQVALVGFGRVTEQPWAHDGMLGVRPVVTATLSADHRASDGLRGGRFLARVDELLQKPEEL